MWHHLPMSRIQQKVLAKSILQRHLKSHHENQTQQCETCGKNFNRVDSLRRHSML